jgi:hypothetical protein
MMPCDKYAGKTGNVSGRNAAGGDPVPLPHMS